MTNVGAGRRTQPAVTDRVPAAPALCIFSMRVCVPGDAHTGLRTSSCVMSTSGVRVCLSAAVLAGGLRPPHLTPSHADPPMPTCQVPPMPSSWLAELGPGTKRGCRPAQGPRVPCSVL